MSSKFVFDTRFFVESFYNKDIHSKSKLENLFKTTSERLVSVVTLYETHRINVLKQGKDVANLRSTIIQRDFSLIPLTPELSIQAAEIGSRHNLPLADCVISATALQYGAPVITDDPHFNKVHGLQTRWPL